MSDHVGPFWRYYGGKFRAAPRYPAPVHPAIVEPFAGAAGYSCRYPDRQVILVDSDPCIAGIWDYLICAQASEILRIPEVEAVADLPAWVPQGGRDLVGFAMNAATVSPCKVLSSGRRKLRALGRVYEGWSEHHRARIASWVDRIRHWRVYHGSYTQIRTTGPATWFVDPPYNNRAGSYYKCGPDEIDFAHLGAWCRGREGQLIVCENEGADWLPFRTFATLKPGVNGKGSREVIYTQ